MANTIFGVTGVDPVQLTLIAGTTVQIDSTYSKARTLAPIRVQIANLASALPNATTTTFGTVKKAATVANVTPATDGTAVGTAFNLLLTNLRAAGIIV